MSYYPSQTGQHPATPGTYPYSAYHPAAPGLYSHPQTPGAYPYQASGAYPATAVTGYGTTAWPYSYSYYQQHHPAITAPRPSVTMQPTATPQTPSTTPSTTGPQRTTFSAYTPLYTRESVAAAATGGAGTRGYRKQSNLKGVFTKECMSILACIRTVFHLPLIHSTKLNVWIWG